MPLYKKPRLKAVLDTNVWVSALIWGGSPARVVKAAEDNKIVVFLSEEIVSEVSQTLAYPKLRFVYENAGLNRVELIEIVLRIGQLIGISSKIHDVCEDPADNKFLDCAVASGVEYLVTGDRHLLKLGVYEKIRIVKVTEFIKIIDALGLKS